MSVKCLAAILLMNLKMRLLLIKQLRILRFMAVVIGRLSAVVIFRDWAESGTGGF